MAVRVRVPPGAPLTKGEKMEITVESAAMHIAEQTKEHELLTGGELISHLENYCQGTEYENSMGFAVSAIETYHQKMSEFDIVRKYYGKTNKSVYLYKPDSEPEYEEGELDWEIDG